MQCGQYKRIFFCSEKSPGWQLRSSKYTQPPFFLGQGPRLMARQVDRSGKARDRPVRSVSASILSASCVDPPCSIVLQPKCQQQPSPSLSRPSHDFFSQPLQTSASTKSLLNASPKPQRLAHVPLRARAASFFFSFACHAILLQLGRTQSPPHLHFSLFF